jgi:hypothetical protein
MYIQAFFAYRIRGISGRWEITIVCWVLSFLTLVWSALGGVESIMAIDNVRYEAHGEAQWSWLILTMLAVSASLDMIIAASLSYYLWTQKQYVHMR